MADSSRLGPWVRRFLLEHLIKERNLSRGTRQSYRDTLTLLIPFVARKVRRSVDAMEVIHVSADLVRVFLLHLEESRGCAISRRNQRLAALHSLARFVALHSPEHIAWCEEICLIPFKKCTQTPGDYLEKVEIDALLAAPNLKTAQGQRDHILLLFLYNTRARADEAAQVLVGNLSLANCYFARDRFRRGPESAEHRQPGSARLLTQSGKADTLIIRFMKKTSITVTEASRNFADCVNRAHYQNVTFVLLKNGEPVARLIPDNEKVCVGRDLAEALAKTDLPENEARVWHRELEAARKSLKAPADKWR